MQPEIVLNQVNQVIITNALCFACNVHILDFLTQFIIFPFLENKTAFYSLMNEMT